MVAVLASFLYVTPFTYILGSLDKIQQFQLNSIRDGRCGAVYFPHVRFFNKFLSLDEGCSSFMALVRLGRLFCLQNIILYEFTIVTLLHKGGNDTLFHAFTINLISCLIAIPTGLFGGPNHYLLEQFVCLSLWFFLNF